MMPKILFLPNYLGGGFGHIGRCLALAESWRDRGGKSVLVVSGPQAARVRETGIQVETPTHSHTVHREKSAPAYTYVPDMAYQVVRDGLDHPWHVWQALGDLEVIVKRVRPDILVGDGYLLSGILGRKLGIPTAQFVKSVVHPLVQAQVAPWEPCPPGLVLPDIRPVFNPVLRWLRQPEVERANQLLSGDLYLMVGGLPCLDPLLPIPQKTYWPGPLLRKISAEKEAAWLDELPTGRPVVYVTIGGATLLGGWSALARLVLEALGGQNITVVLSTGGLENLVDSCLPENIVIKPWVPTRQMLRRCDAVIFHGGYTRLEILSEGRPSIILPGHSEQEYYGRLMEEAGAARVLSLNDEPFSCHKAHWRGGRWFGGRTFTIFAREAITMPTERLRLAVEEVVHSSEISRKAMFLKTALEETGGCELALDLITELAR